MSGIKNKSSVSVKMIQKNHILKLDMSPLIELILEVQLPKNYHVCPLDGWSVG